MVPRNNIYTECFRVPDRGLKISTNEEETTKERLGAIPSEKWDQLVQSLQGRDELDKLEEQTRTVRLDKTEKWREWVILGKKSVGTKFCRSMWTTAQKLYFILRAMQRC